METCSSAHAQTHTVVSPLAVSYIAGVSQGIRVVVRSLPSLAVHAVFAAIDRVEQIAFSPNGSLILAVVPSQGVVHVWSLDNQNWTCRIDSGSAGISKAEFHPSSSLHVLVWSDFNLRLDVWDVFSGKRAHLKHVKGSIALGKDGDQYGAILSRNNHKNSINIIDLECGELNFTLVQSFLVPGVGDLAGLVWTGSGNALVAYESPLTDRVHLLDLKGQILISHSLNDASSSLGLGARTQAHSKSVIAFGGFDQSIRFFSIWKSLDFLCRISLKSDEIFILDDSPVVLRETLGGGATLRERNMFHLGGANTQQFPVEYRDASRDETSNPKLQLLKLPSVDQCTPFPGSSTRTLAPSRGGVLALEMSPDGAFLAAQTDEKSSVVFLIEIAKLKVTNILIHRQPVRCFRWNPLSGANRSQLAVVTGDSRVLIWNPTMDNRTVELKDSSLNAIDVQWASQGNVLVVSSKENVCSVLIDIPRENSGG